MLEDHNINLNEEINKLFPEDVNKIEIGKLKEGKVKNIISLNAAEAKELEKFKEIFNKLGDKFITFLNNFDEIKKSSIITNPEKRLKKWNAYINDKNNY